MSLFVKITSIILLTLVLLLIGFGWFSVLDEEKSLEAILDKHGNAIARVVADFSVDPLLLEDYPVLETVLASFGKREDNVLSIEVRHNGVTVASYYKDNKEQGRTFVSPVNVHDALGAVMSHLGEIHLRLSQEDNRAILLARQKEIVFHIIAAFFVLLLSMAVILRKTVLNRLKDLTRRIDSVSADAGMLAPGGSGPAGGRFYGDELDSLSERFDDMVGSVRDYNEKLKAEVAWRTEDLNEAKEAAEEANLAKSKFLAAASHDLRQPLQALSMYAGTLKLKTRDSELLPVVDRISSGIQVMNELLTALLDVSRLDAGVVVPSPRQFAVSDLFDELEAEYTGLARDKGIAFRISRTSLRTESDPVLLGRILRNLVNNAIRYTDQGGILLGCRRHVENFHINVYDTGIGIPNDQLQEVFKDYHQIGNLARDRRLGLGLGLAIAKGMAGLLGHRISVTSLPGRGSCFSIELPRARLVQDASVEDQQEQPRTVERHCILVIDDEQDIIDSFEMLLGTYGYNVISALSARDAIQQLQYATRKPDIIVADYRLDDGRNGSDAILEVGRACGMEIPGILLTGDTDPDRIASAARSGFSLLHKPLESGALVSAIEERLAEVQVQSSSGQEIPTM